MLDCLIEMAAHAAGLTDAQLAVIEKELPACRRLIDLLVKAQPIIKQAQPLLDEAMPLVNQALVEVKAIQPAINIVIGVVQRDLAAGHSIQQSFNTVSKRVTSALGWGEGS